MPLDKMGRPYTPMTEAEKEAHRSRPFDFGPIQRTREQIEMRQRQKATEAPRTYHAEDSRATIEPMAKAITRQARKVRRSRG